MLCRLFFEIEVNEDIIHKHNHELVKVFMEK